MFDCTCMYLWDSVWIANTYIGMHIVVDVINAVDNVLSGVSECVILQRCFDVCKGITTWL